MLRPDVVNQIHKRHVVSHAFAKRLTDSLLGIIEDALLRGERVILTGFGTFRVSKIKSRVGRNPSTGKAITIPSHKRIVFTPSKTLKRLLK